VLVLLAVRPVADGLGRALHVDQGAAAADGGVERLVGEIHGEAEPVALIGSRRFEIVHEKLRRDGLQMGRALNVGRRHVAVLSG
jgi:hypothetical protein